jgi:hypothetical protein
MSVFFILEHALDLIYFFSDNEGNIVGGNHVYKEYTSHLKPKKVKDLVQDELDVESLVDSINKAKQITPSPVRFYTKIKQKSGAPRWVLWNVYYITGAIHYVGIQVYDIHSVTQHEFERQRVLLEEFRFMLSHELRQPLTSISSLVGLMVDKGISDPQEHQKILEMIAESVTVLDNSIRALVKKAAREV